MILSIELCVEYNDSVANAFPLHPQSICGRRTIIENHYLEHQVPNTENIRQKMEDFLEQFDFIDGQKVTITVFDEQSYVIFHDNFNPCARDWFP